MFNWIKNFRLPRPTGQGLRTAALFMGAPIFGGLLIWQLRELDPKRACDMGFFIASKSAELTLKDAFLGCLGIYAKIIDVRDHAILGVIGILGLGYMMMMMRELRMQGEATLPGGAGIKIRSDATDAADEVADAAVDKAKEIKSEAQEV
jgi:uncharacterized membrane protein YedE/YeeE